MPVKGDGKGWLETKISEIVNRASFVSSAVIRKVENGTMCKAVLHSYFSSVVTNESDFSFIGEPFFRCSMCDNMLLQAGICTLAPLPNVLFLSTSFYPWLFRSMEEYKCTIRENRGFVYKVEPYAMLMEATADFEHIPTIILPINFSLHWGYVIVAPDLKSGVAVIMWGDSLRYCPPSGLLETLRLYLVLLYRGVRFVISTRNHALDVLGFARQKDGFSCGFYVLAVMSCFASGSSDDQYPVRSFEEYDRGVTEEYREVCIRSYVLHILCVATSQTPPVRFGLFEVSASIMTECRKVLKEANDGVSNMYPGMAPHELLALRREDSCELVQGVTIIVDEREHEGENGIVSKLYTCEEQKPFIRTSLRDSGIVSLSFGDIIDLGTIFSKTENTFLISPVPQAAAVEKGDEHECRVVQNDTAATMGSNPEETGVASALPISALCNEAVPGTEGAEAGKAAHISSYDTEEACHNIFAYLERRLSEGHLLRKPEYQHLKGGDFRFRLRLRCRFYDPPPGYTGSKGSYQRCQARLYARLLKNDGGWRLSFRFLHNHAIVEHAYLGEIGIHKRLLGLQTSLSKHYPGAVSEFDEWRRGERFRRSCPAVHGCLDVASIQRGSCNDVKKPDPNGLEGEVSELYIDIAPRPNSVCPPQERLENPVELVNDCVTGGHVLGPGKENDNDLVPLSVEYTDTLRKYVQGCTVTCDGRDLKGELKYLSECFGFPMVVRTSQYFHKRSDSEHAHHTPQVRRLTFKCPVGENNRLKKDCKYWFTVVSAATSFLEDRGEIRPSDEEATLLRPFVINFRECWHSHKPDESTLRRSLPAYVWREAITLKDKSLIRTVDIVRYLEDHYNLRLDRKVFSRKLRWEMGKRHPAERDCQNLVSNLMRYTQLNPGMFCEARVNRDNALHSVCWGFPQWRDEYKQFGIIPGVTIDAKALANNYDTPLAFICGRTNNRAVTVFFMGFLASQREEEFLWMLECFKRFVNIPPRLVACDQDSAIINSVERVFPSTLVILDDWHLTKNQLKNSIALAKHLGDASRSKEISKALWALRESREESEFLERRRLFEEQYLGGGVIPRWFVSLYHTNHKLVVLCYNRSSCGERFLFQGSGYAEAANSQYRRIIMDRKVPMSRVPEEILRYMENRVSERHSDLRTTKFSGQMASISVSQLGFDEEEWLKVVELFVPYAWDIVTKQSISLAHKYTVDGCETLVHEKYGEVFSFKVVQVGAEESTSTRSYTVVCPKSYASSYFIPHMCTCHWSNSAGLPCRHASRVATFFQEYTKCQGRFPLELMFHHYWRKDTSAWSTTQIIQARLGALNHYGMSNLEEGSTVDNRSERDQKRNQDRMQSVFWNNGQSVWNQMHRRISRKGIIAMQKLDRLMALLFEEVVRGEGNEGFDIGAVARRLKEAVEKDNGFGATATRRLELSNLQEDGSKPIDGSIKNSAHGAVKGRGTMKRARSWTENTDGKKPNGVKRGNKRKKKVHFLLDGVASQPVQTTNRLPSHTTLTQ